MHIGIFSDVHDNLSNLKRMMAFFTERGIDTLIFCGDFCSPIPARVLGSFGGTVHCVFGNGDGDRLTIERIARSDSPNLVIHGEWAELDIEDATFAVTHYPFYAQGLARTEDYRAVFSGHTHERHQERFGECLWLNPGEVLGWKGPATCAVYDTTTNDAEYIEL